MARYNKSLRQLTDSADIVGFPDTMMCNFSSLRAMAKAPRDNIQNVANWLSNRDNKAIHADETGFVRASDLVTLSTANKSRLRSFFEQNILYRIVAWLGGGKHGGSSDHDFSVQGDDRLVDSLVVFLVFLVATVMLIVPLWVLAHLHSLVNKLVLITVFLLVLLVVLTMGTLARPFEILATAAG